MNSGFLVRYAITSLVAFSALILPAGWAQGQQSSIVARYTGTVEKTAEMQQVRPEATQGTSAVNAIAFNAAQVGVSGSSAQTLTATFAVSGYVGSFTPTASLHYGHDYSLGTIACTPNGATESCTVPVQFLPTLPGMRKDAIFLMNGTTRLTTVLLGGLGQGPFALLQPGVFTTSIPTTNYLYQSVVDENGTVWLLTGGNTGYIVRVDKAGVVTQIPITTARGQYPQSMGIDGAGVLYIFDEEQNVITYDTVMGTQGTFTIPVPGNFYWYPGTVGSNGNIFVLNEDTHTAYQFKPDGTMASTFLSPSVNQESTMVVDSSGDLFVGGYTINEITAGGVQTQVNAVGAGDGLGVDAAGTLYATRYSPTGGVAELPASNYSAPIASVDTSSSPLGASVGSDGTVFVSNYVNLDVFNRSVSQSSSSIDFGQVAGGSSTTSNLGQLYNGGNQPLTITAISLAGSAFTLQAGGAIGCSEGGQIAPGALCQFGITFAPTHPGLYTGTIAITTDSLNNTGAIQNLVVQGEVEGVYLTVSPTTLPLGPQASGTTSATFTETITNSGFGQPVNIGTPTSTDTAFSATIGTCSAPLAVGASCRLNVTFSPTAVQAYSATISVPFTGASFGNVGTPATFAVTGTGITPPAPVALLTPASLSFSKVTIGTPSTSQTATLKNTGNATLTITSISIAGANPTDFSETNNCGASLDAGNNCQITVTFTPASVASFSGTLTVADNAAGAPHTVALTGTGTAVPAPAVTLAPGSLTFTATSGTTSSAQTATLSNTGNAALGITSVAITGANPSDFTQSNTCGSSLAAGAKCTISIEFAPASVASFAAALTVTDNASGSPHTVALSGTGTAVPAPVAVLTPPSLGFASIQTGSSSSAQIATLSNTGNAALSITSIMIGGANAADFAQSNTCGSSVAAGTSCSISVTFTPLSAASFAASLTVTDNAAGSPRSVSLSGTGTVPPAPGASITPAGPLSFAAVTGATSQSQTVTLTNTGDAALSITSVTLGGANATDFAQTNTCGSSVPAGANCTIAITFTPLSAASFTASLSVADNAGNSPQTVTLNGTGSAPATFTLASETAAGNASQTMAATFVIDVTPENGSISSPITFSASGVPQGYTATFSPSTVTPDSKATSVKMTIADSTIAANRNSAWPMAAPALALVGLCFLSRKQRKRMLTLCVLALVSIGAIGSLSGCGGGFALARPPQTYTITITASGANQTQTTTVQLTVE